MLIIAEVNVGRWVGEVFYIIIFFLLLSISECCHHEKKNKAKLMQVKWGL